MIEAVEAGGRESFGGIRAREMQQKQERERSRDGTNTLELHSRNGNWKEKAVRTTRT